MDKQERNLVEDFFDHKLGVAATTREEYDSLCALLRRLKPNITWHSGDNLCDYDGFVPNIENTFITYYCSGTTHGNVKNTRMEIISYELFKSFVDGKSLTFEEVLFGEESR